MQVLTVLMVLLLQVGGDQTPDIGDATETGAISILFILIIIGAIVGAAGVYMLRRRSR